MSVLPVASSKGRGFKPRHEQGCNQTGGLYGRGWVKSRDHQRGVLEISASSSACAASLRKQAMAKRISSISAALKCAEEELSLRILSSSSAARERETSFGKPVTIVGNDMSV